MPGAHRVCVPLAAPLFPRPYLSPPPPPLLPPTPQEGFVNDDSKVVRCPLTNKLKLHALSPGYDSIASSRGTSPRHPGVQLRAQLNSANLVDAVIRHTTWSADGDNNTHHNTLATAARAVGAN